MGARLTRTKERKLFVSLLYRLGLTLPLTMKLDLAWLFHRLASEATLHQPSKDFLFSGLKQTDRVLDLGCSTGELTARIAAKVLNVTGIDHNAKSIEQARKSFPSLTFETGDVRDHVATGYDVLILSHVLEHIDDPEGFLRQVSKHFERIYIEVPDFDSTVLNQVRLGRSPYIFTDADHVSEFDRDELRSLVEGAQLKVEAEEYRFGVMRLWLGQASPRQLEKVRAGHREI